MSISADQVLIEGIQGCQNKPATGAFHQLFYCAGNSEC